jgi:methylated-DNA-[protein]-cysteine S-methyltransferase
MTLHPRLEAQARLATPLGWMTAAATPDGLAGLWFDGQAHHPGPLAVPEDAAQPWLRAAAQALDAYFTGRPLPPLRFNLHGSPFQQAVWRALQALPPGTTTTYARIAAAAGSPAAVRAAGAAIGRNPVSILVPCHRVLGRDGSLTGYAGGLPRKQALLALEGALPVQDSLPDTAAAA